MKARAGRILTLTYLIKFTVGGFYVFSWNMHPFASSFVNTGTATALMLLYAVYVPFHDMVCNQVRACCAAFYFSAAVAGCVSAGSTDDLSHNQGLYVFIFTFPISIFVMYRCVHCGRRAHMPLCALEFLGTRTRGACSLLVRGVQSAARAYAGHHAEPQDCGAHARGRAHARAAHGTHCKAAH
ncbi:hypothetical protein EON66_08505 [archaeon]|nr:MAG: hypothetical protein EON66_08505 [archaeon]